MHVAHFSGNWTIPLAIMLSSEYRHSGNIASIVFLGNVLFGFTVSIMDDRLL